MTIGSGLGSSIGSGIETTYGTSAVPTQWTPVDAPQIKLNPHFEQGVGLRAGADVTDIADHVLTTADAGGTVKMEVYAKGVGRWIGCLMGSLTSGVPVMQSTGVYKQIHAWQNQAGNSLTLQEGVPQTNGTVEDYVTVGAKVTEATFDLSASGLLEASFTIDGRDRLKLGANIGAPSYLTAAPPFAWQQAVVSMGPYGSEVPVPGIKKVGLSYKRALSAARFNVGAVSSSPLGYGIKQEPIPNGWADIQVTLDTEYLTDAEFVALFRSQTQQSIIVTFTGANIPSTTTPASITFAFPTVIFEGTDPTVTGPDIVQPSMTGMVRNDSTNKSGVAVSTITIVSGESTL
jgi:hypothetical protein